MNLKSALHVHAHGPGSCDDGCGASGHRNGAGPVVISLRGEGEKEGTKGEAADQRRTVFDVADLCCQSEVDLIEKALQGVDGINEYSVNIAAGTLALYHDGAEARSQEVVEKLQKVGLRAEARRSLGRADVARGNPFSAHFWVIIIGAVLTGLGVFFRYFLGAAMPGAAFFGAAIGIGGFFVYRQAWTAVQQRKLNIPVLVTIAVVGAAVIGEWFEAATVILLFAFAEWLEARSMARARGEIGALMELSPQSALRIGADGSVEEVSLDEIEIGDRLKVRPGSKIPVDALILEGRSEVDESTITGEAIPVTKKPGSEVFSGTVNGAGALTIQALQTAAKSTLAQIIDAIEDARANQSPTEQFIDRFARVYTPAVVGIAALVAIVPPLWLGAEWIDWFYRSLVFLVIACPCALVISTPIANVAGLARAAREGVLVKGGKHLEQLGKLRALAFDKTGTLTAGRPLVEEVIPFGDRTPDEVLRFAALVEAESEHHIGRAILERARHRLDPAALVASVKEVKAEVGQGVEGVLREEDGEEIALRVGNQGWLEELGVRVNAVMGEKWTEIEGRGETVVGVARGMELLGLISLQDRIRREAPQALQALKARGVEATYVLTGDNRANADRVAGILGIEKEKVFARLLPREKVARVEELRERHEIVAMVGDGVNDAPALAAATVGVAMGAAGTDVALESADVALMGDDLGRLSAAMEIGAKTSRVILQNIVIALGLKAIFLVLAILGIATLWMAIVADMGASLIVIFNAIRLLKKPGEAKGGGAVSVGERDVALSMGMKS